MKNTTLNPYLNFDGKCKEAMYFYKDIFGGKLEMMTFENSPLDVPEDYKSKIMHASLDFDNGVIMASDTMPETKIKYGNSNSINVAENDPKRAEMIFNSLAQDGEITQEFKETFWDAKFGSVIDKFGIHWMVNCDLS